MRGILRYWPILIGSLTGAACAGLISNVRQINVDHIRISHARHIQAQVDCAACHDSVYDATDLKDHHLPAEAKCMECHKEKKDQGNCGFCHSNASNIQPRPPMDAKLSFNHSKHIDLVKEDCTQCHKELPEIDRPASPPPMTACLQCHEHKTQYDQGECGTCHNDLWMNPIKPQGEFAHEANFLHEHMFAARSSSAACSQCHDQNFCSDCHASTVAMGPDQQQFDRVDRQFIHRGNFLAVHPTEARADPASCERCHQTTFCESCHNAQNFGSGGTDPRNPHPPGWAFPGSPEFHGDAAREEVETCAVCHDHGGHPDCITCHRVGGIGGNPHPSSFLSRNRNVDRRNPACLECHL